MSETDPVSVIERNVRRWRDEALEQGAEGKIDAYDAVLRLIKGIRAAS